MMLQTGVLIIIFKKVFELDKHFIIKVINLFAKFILIVIWLDSVTITLQCVIGRTRHNDRIHFLQSTHTDYSLTAYGILWSNFI